MTETELVAGVVVGAGFLAWYAFWGLVHLVADALRTMRGWL